MVMMIMSGGCSQGDGSCGPGRWCGTRIVGGAVGGSSFAFRWCGGGGGGGGTPSISARCIVGTLVVGEEGYRGVLPPLNGGEET